MNKRDSIAAHLRSRRAFMKLGRREAAEAIGASASTLDAWENQGGIGLEEAWTAADYYRCTLDELAGRPWPPNVEDLQNTTIGAVHGNSSRSHR